MPDLGLTPGYTHGMLEASVRFIPHFFLSGAWNAHSVMWRFSEYADRVYHVFYEMLLQLAHESILFLKF